MKACSPGTFLTRLTRSVGAAMASETTAAATGAGSEDVTRAVWLTTLLSVLAVALAANNIDSLGRYGLMLVPAWAVGYAETFRRRDVWAAICGLSTLGFVWYTTLVWLGQVVP